MVQVAGAVVVAAIAMVGAKQSDRAIKLAMMISFFIKFSLN